MNNLPSADSVNLAPQPPRSKALLTWMIISQLLVIFPILILGGLGVFGFLLDGTIDFYMFAYYLSPLITLIPLIASWVAYSRRNEKAAWILTSLPLLYVCGDMAVLFNGILF